MHTTDHPYFPEKPMLPLGNQIGYYMQNFPMTSSFLNGSAPPGNRNPMPCHNVNIQPSNACPRNFIIFDQTNNRSQIMFHPEVNSKLFYPPSFGVETSLFQDDVVQNDENDQDKIGSPMEEEDYDDIDALLSTEYEENEEVEDDEVSTARTGACYDCSSSDSCSNYETSPKKRRKLFGKSSGIQGNEKKKHKRVRKMVKALRGIVPGANRMGTVAVLDESVRYLESLRVEVQKLGITKFEG